MRVAVRVDAGPVIGGGHAMRCLALADALAMRGLEVIFVSSAMPSILADRIRRAGHRVDVIAGSPDPVGIGASWHETILDDAAQAGDVSNTAAAVGPVDWLIVDHYLLDQRWHSAARNFADKILVIDDLANRAYDCDALVDANFGREASDYEVRLPPAAKVLVGSRFALLRPEFARERPAAIERRKANGEVRRILISMGTTDPNGVTLEALKAALAVAGDVSFDVVLGPQANSSPQVEALAAVNPAVTIHFDIGQIADLMRDADLAIGAAGTTSWERCCLGLPCIAIILAENQRVGASALQAAGAVVVVDDVEEVGAALGSLLSDRERVARMSAAAFAIADGCGIGRVAAVVFGDEGAMEAPLSIRPAEVSDSETLWLWRNDPETRTQSRNQEPISWTEHFNWLTHALADPRQRIFVVERAATPVATVGFRRQDDDGHEVAISVAPDHRDEGVGSAALDLGCEAMAGAGPLLASVREENAASRRLFERHGFRPVDTNEPGFVRYRNDNAPPRRRQA